MFRSIFPSRPTALEGVAGSGRPRGRAARREPVRAAALEALEDRRLFSVTVNGTPGPDVISVYQAGASFNVTVNGVTTNTGSRPVTDIKINCLGGSDNVFLSAGITLPTFIYGGEGNDTIKGGRGADYIDGGSGKDTIRGSDGNDTIRGMGGDDTIYAGLGDDNVQGGRGNDYIDGEQDHDFLLGNGTPNDGTAYSDNDVIRGGEGNDLIDGMGGADAVYGDWGIDEVHGGEGDDHVYGGADNDRLLGGNGDDVLVSIGGGTGDLLWGEAGRDSFWLDDARTTELVLDGDAVESANSNFHFVGQFENNVIRNNGQTTQERPGKELHGQNLVDPLSPFATASFRNRPLFGQFGPLAIDAKQGGVGDCYFIAGLSAIAKTNAYRIREAVVDLGDGTYAVRFARNGVAKYYRVDGDLPVLSDGTPAYAQLGVGGTTWVAVMEKAFAYHKWFDGGQYAMLDLGRADEPFKAIAAPCADFWGTSGNDVFVKIKQQLDLGRAVVASTVNDSPLHEIAFIEKHQYSVHSVDLVNGRIYLRNPWGYDGAGNDSNPQDGFVSFTRAEFFEYFRGATWAKV